MKVELNGSPREVGEGTDVLSLVGSLGLDPQWVVVEHNLHALDRSRWESTALSDGDQVEIVRFMGGG